MADEREQSIEAELRLKLPAAELEQIKKAAEYVQRMTKDVNELAKASEKAGQQVKRDFMGIAGGTAGGVPASQFFGTGGSVGGSGGSGWTGPRMGGGRRPPIAGSSDDAARLERLERFRSGGGSIPPPGGSGGGSIPPPGGSGGGSNPPGGGGGGGSGGGNGYYSTRRDGGYELINGHPFWAVDRFFGFRGKLAAGAGLGIGATLGAASARNAAFTSDIRGQTGGDAARAALESNWFTRQGMSAYDTVSNRDGLLAQVGIQSQRAEVAQQLRMQLGGNLSTMDSRGRAVNLGQTTGSFERDWEARKLGVQSRIDAYGQDPRVATLGYYDRSTVASDVAFREAQARQPIRERGIELNRERLAIGNETAGTEAALAKTKEDLKRLNTARNQASLRASAGLAEPEQGKEGWLKRNVLNALVPDPKPLNNLQVGPDSAKRAAERAAALDEEKRIIAEITALEETRKQQDDKLVALGEKKAQNAKEEKQNKLEFIQLNARELAQRADKAEGQAGNIGQMTPLERQMNLNYLKAFLETEDKSQLPAGVIAGARKLAPGTVDKAFVEFGAKDTGFLSELQKLAPGEYRDTNLPAARKAAQDAANEVAKEKPKIDLEFLQDFKKFTLNDTLKKEFQDVLTAINDNVNKEIARQLLDFRQANKQ